MIKRLILLVLFTLACLLWGTFAWSQTAPAAVTQSGVISTNNSTTTALGGAGTFTGVYSDTLRASSVTIIVNASHNSAASGVTFDWSSDGTNLDYSTNATYTAGAGAVYQFPVRARFFRVTYTNGGTPQTHLRIQTIMRSAADAQTAGTIAGTVDVTSVIPGTAATNAGKAEDAPHSSGDTGGLSLAVRNDAGTALAGTDLDYIPLSTDSNGNLRVTTATPNTQYAEDSPHSSGDTGNLVLVVVNDSPDAMAAEGDRSVLITDAESRLHVAALLVDSTGAALPLASDATHDQGVVASGPQMMGAAVAHGANPTAVTAGDATRFTSNRAGVQFVIGGHPNPITRECQVEDADGAQTGTACVTVSTGTKIAVTALAVHCDASTTNPTNIIVALDTDGTFPARAHTGADGFLAGFDGVPPGGGMVKGGGGGLLAVGADDQDLRFTMEDPVGGACSVEATYYTIES